MKSVQFCNFVKSRSGTCSTSIAKARVEFIPPKAMVEPVPPQKIFFFKLLNQSNLSILLSKLIKFFLIINPHWNWRKQDRKLLWEQFLQIVAKHEWNIFHQSMGMQKQSQSLYFCFCLFHLCYCFFKFASAKKHC